MEVNIFIPCFIDQLFPETGFNMVKVLEKLGCKVHYNPNQTCCGQPAHNAGHWKESRKVAEKFLDDFPGNRPIVIPSASCSGFICNNYEGIFVNSSYHNTAKQVRSQTYELTQFLVHVLKVTDVGAKLAGKATYHDSCSGLRECNIKEEPRKLLESVEGLELQEMNDLETCCGFGGTFSIKFEPISSGMGEQKLNNAIQTDADYLISTDLSCLLHLDGFIKKQNLDLKVMHIADVLASGW